MLAGPRLKAKNARGESTSADLLIAEELLVSVTVSVTVGAAQKVWKR